ncbi:MAG: hypothetical protein WBB94_01525 [Candidatus Saccharimonadaceae bacterium]
MSTMLKTKKQQMKRLLHIFVSTVSLFTATGLFMHEMHVDQALSTFEYRTYSRVSLTSLLTSMQLQPGKVELDMHTHVDHNPANSLLSLNNMISTPSIIPRSDYRRHMLQNEEPKGRHAFDNIYLPLIS